MLAAAAAESVPEEDMAATAVCNEVWWWRRVDTKTGAVRAPPKRVRYRMRYALVLEGGRWLVDRLTMISSEELPGGG